MNEFDKLQDKEHIQDMEKSAIKLLRVLDRVYEEDRQFILTILGTALCTLGVGMYGTTRFKKFLDQIHFQIDETFGTTDK